MHRPIVFSAALASALAAGSLLGAPGAHADETPAPVGQPDAPTVETPGRTGRADDAPLPSSEPVAAPESPVVVRTGRVGDVPEPSATDDADDADDADPEVDVPPEPSPPRSTPAGPDRSTPAAGPTTGAGAAPEGPAPEDAGSAPPASAPPVPASAVPATHTVVAGDNLWEIAAARLAVISGRARAELGAVEIAPYWTRVCMLNRDRLASGDESLIYPDEVIELPEP